MYKLDEAELKRQRLLKKESGIPRNKFDKNKKRNLERKRKV